MKFHTRRQWEAIYGELDRKFYCDSLLKPKSMEHYLIEHFKSMISTWKSHWVANGENACLDTCLEECWKSLVAFWKTLAIAMESS